MAVTLEHLVAVWLLLAAGILLGVSIAGTVGALVIVREGLGGGARRDGCRRDAGCQGRDCPRPAEPARGSGSREVRGRRWMDIDMVED